MQSIENFASSKPDYIKNILKNSSNQREIVEQINMHLGPEWRPTRITHPLFRLDNPFENPETLAQSIMFAIISSRTLTELLFMCGKYEVDKIKSRIPGSFDKVTRKDLSVHIAKEFLNNPRAIGYTLKLITDERSGAGSYEFSLLVPSNPKLDRNTLLQEAIVQKAVAITEARAAFKENTTPMEGASIIEEMLAKLDWNPYYLTIDKRK
jgi:hypothetical protein